MSDSNPLDLTALTGLQLKPNWVDEVESKERFKNFDQGPDRGNWNDRRPPRSRDGAPGGRPPERDNRPPGPDRRREGGPGRPAFDQNRGRPGERPLGPRPPGDRPRPEGNRPPGDGDRRGYRGPPGDDRPQRPPLYEFVDTDLIPDEKGVDAVARQIKMTGRAYPIFDLARLILNSDDRFRVRFRLHDGELPVDLVRCKADDSYWLSRAEALRHFWNSAACDAFYKREQVQVEPPKGNYSVVALCGMSGIILGPPNFHGYVKNLHDLHIRRFSHLPLEVYKRRIEMLRDEETMQKWKDSLSTEVQYTYLKGDAESPLIMKSLAEVESHFMTAHGEETFQSLREVQVPGNIPPKLISGALLNLLRRAIERQKKVPIQLVKALSPQLEGAGLKFFKLDKKETFVARSRPRAMDLGKDMSERIQKIFSFVRDNSGKDLNVLVSSLVEVAAPADAAGPSVEEVAVLKDLRWMIREGYITEFSDGGLQIIINRGGTLIAPPVAREPRPPRAPQAPREPKPAKPRERKNERRPRRRRATLVSPVPRRRVLARQADAPVSPARLQAMTPHAWRAKVAASKEPTRRASRRS